MIYDATKSPHSGGGPELIDPGRSRENPGTIIRKPILFFLICTFFYNLFHLAIAIECF